MFKQKLKTIQFQFQLCDQKFHANDQNFDVYICIYIYTKYIYIKMKMKIMV
jgi:hypothetical protein